MRNQKRNQAESAPMECLPGDDSPAPRRKVLACRVVDATVANEATLLMTESVRKRLPKLYATENVNNPVVQVRYRAWSLCDWNAIEFDGVDVFFGFFWHRSPVWGYFRLSDLEESNRLAHDNVIVIDRFFEPRPVSAVMMDYYYD